MSSRWADSGSWADGLAPSQLDRGDSSAVGNRLDLVCTSSARTHQQKGVCWLGRRKGYIKCRGWVRKQRLQGLPGNDPVLQAMPGHQVGEVGKNLPGDSGQHCRVAFSRLERATSQVRNAAGLTLRFQ